MSLLRLSVEVSQALADRRPVLALESTIISHGMPYPRNRDTALQAEAAAREAGVVPAVVALLDGRIAVGLSGDDVERLARERDVLKVSRRDLAWALTTGRVGATTVSATMFAARQAGIDVFATGGIGGVHRGASETFDLSADLAALSDTPICVVSAGAKAILDLPKTLEALETLGVPVVGYGTSEFPAFYSRSSGLTLGLRVDSPDQVAQLLATQHALGLRQAILVANPVPAESEIPAAAVAGWIDQAMRDLRQKGLEGKAVTPFLLARIVELSAGAALACNIQLFHNNVRLACAIARACAGRTV